MSPISLQYPKHHENITILCSTKLSIEIPHYPGCLLLCHLIPPPWCYFLCDLWSLWLLYDFMTSWWLCSSNTVITFSILMALVGNIFVAHMYISFQHYLLLVKCWFGDTETMLDFFPFLCRSGLKSRTLSSFPRLLNYKLKWLILNMQTFLGW